MRNTTLSPRRKKRKRIWPWVLMCLAFVCAAMAGALFASSSLFDNNTSNNDATLMAKDKATVMIMGVDERDDDVGRSDTLMIAALDPKKEQAALLSIPRDTRVKIKGHGFDKINAAYAYGGHKLTQDTVEKFIGVPMDHYVIINIKAFQRIIDALGGIDINVEKRMFYEDPWDDDGGLVIDLRPGQQHMDGKTAVTYVRYRDEEGDIGRIGRQQKFMKAVMDKVTSPAIIPQLPTIIKEVLSSVKTDLSLRQMLEFAGALKEAQKNGLKTEMVPGRGLYIEGISYWIPDISKLRSTLADTLGVTMNSSMRSAMEKESRDYENSIPANAAPTPANDTSLGHMPASSESSKTKKKTSSDSSSSRDTTATTRKEKPSAGDSGTGSTTPTAPAATEERTNTSPAPTPSPGAGSAGKSI